MHVMLLALVLQVVPQITMPRAPATLPPPPQQTQPPKAPQISAGGTNTTPSLELNDTALTHAQMERDIGGQGEAISSVKVRIATLEKLRADPDRKDIESLKELRTTITIWVSAMVIVLGAIFGFFWKFNGIIWSDIIRPRLKKDLGIPEAATTPPVG